jgi:hypothetical protein
MFLGPKRAISILPVYSKRIRVGKIPVFFKKPSRMFFWGFIGFIVFLVFLYICPEE